MIVHNPGANLGSRRPAGWRISSTVRNGDREAETESLRLPPTEVDKLFLAWDKAVSVRCGDNLELCAAANGGRAQF